MSTHIADGSEILSPQTPAGSDNTGLIGLAHEVRDAGEAFCKEVYKHSTAVEVGVGAVAVGALAIYAGREQLGRVLPAITKDLIRGAGKEAVPGLEKDILLVEDTPFMGKAIKTALEQNGEHVTWITSVQDGEPLTGKTLEGLEVKLDPGKFKLAFVDGQLDHSLQGEDVVRALHKGGVPSIGTSTIADLNTLMRANGAEVTAQKATVVGALVGNKLDIAAAVRSPLTAQKSLDLVALHLNGPLGVSLRQKSDELLTRCMLETLGT